MSNHTCSSSSWYSDNGMPNYFLSETEARELVHYWLTVYWNSEIFGFFTNQSVYKDQARAAHALRKLKDVLGASEIDMIEENVLSKVRLQMGEDNWHIYWHGTTEEIRRLQEEEEAACDPNNYDEFPQYAVELILRHTLTLFRRQPHSFMVRTLRRAADAIDSCDIELPSDCSHEWYNVQHKLCRQCGAIRDNGATVRFDIEAWIIERRYRGLGKGTDR